MLEQDQIQNSTKILLNDKVGPILKLPTDSIVSVERASSTWFAILIFCLFGCASLVILIPLSQSLIRSPWSDDIRLRLPSLHGLIDRGNPNSYPETSDEKSSNLESTLTIKIGHVAPTSGAIAHLGQDNEYGARMAIEELNLSDLRIGSRAVKFELLTEDDAANPSQGIAVAQKLINAKVNGVIGHLNSGTTIPASQLYNAAGIPQISPSATNPKYTRQGYFGAFRLVADDTQLGSTLGKIAVQNFKGINIAVIDDRTAYGAGLAEAFKIGVTTAGGTIVAHEFTTDKATDFYSILNSIKSKKPDIVFFGGMDNVAAPMLRQMKSLGMQTRFMGGDGICTWELAKLAGDAVINDSVFCAEAGGIEDSHKAAMDKFRSDFKIKFGSDVQIYAPYVYDAVKVMAMAMITAGSSDPNIYLPALKAISHKGLTGDISFDDKGDLRNAALTIYTYRRGERILLDVIR